MRGRDERMKGFRVIRVIRGAFDKLRHLLHWFVEVWPKPFLPLFRGITCGALPYLPPVPRADTRGYNVAFTLHESLFWRFSESLIT